MIVLLSDFDLRGSGYMHIAVSLCNELATRHNKLVTALGIGYDMSEHNWPFQIIPVRQSEWGQHVPAIIYNFRAMAAAGQWHPVEAIVVALDIPLQERMLQVDRGGAPYIGIFPIESGPLNTSWAYILSQMTQSLVISEFGARMMKDAGVDGGYLPVGIDCDSWRMPQEEERRAIRKSLGFDDNDFVVLTVADNQERKNLSLAMKMIAEARKKINAKWMLVTRVNSPVGWKLDDLAMYMGLTEHFTKFDKGLPFDRLWILYAAADAFLLTSKAEGLCLPVLEAMSCGLPVIATNCTAIPEHLWEEPDWSACQDGRWLKGRHTGKRGLTIPVDYWNIDPWGNSYRAFPSIKEGVNQIIKLSKMKQTEKEKIIKAGRAYALERNWRRAGNILNETIERAISMVQPDQPPDIAGLPASAPRPIPIITEGSFGHGTEASENQEAEAGPSPETGQETEGFS